MSKLALLAAVLVGAVFCAAGCAGGGNPAKSAMDRGDMIMLRSVLDTGYDVNQKVAIWPHNLLDYAACWGYDDAVKLLLDRGMDVNKGWEFNKTHNMYNTPLMRALQCNSAGAHPTTVRLLLDRGAKVDPVSLKMVSTNYNDRSVTAMVREAYELQSQGKSAAKPAASVPTVPGTMANLVALRRTVDSGDINAVLAYVREHPNARTNEGSAARTADLAFYSSLRARDLPMAKALAAAGADATLPDALDIAVVQGTEASVRWLLEQGADPRAPLRWGGGTAYQSAKENKKSVYLEWFDARADGPAPSVTRLAARAPREPSSDIDAPRSRGSERPDDFALVIGVEEYQSLPKADYGVRDAQTVRKHLEALGFPARNIISLEGPQATGNKLKSYLEEWLPLNVKPTSTLFVYYSGHGAPDPKTGDAYLVPWDGDATFLKSTAYPLKKFYADLSKTKAKRVLVALDACFSGAGGRSVLAQGARPLVAKVAEVSGGERVTILAAASGEEITGSLNDQGHGMFTYFLLKGLSEGKRTAKELHSYLTPRVQDEARRQNRQQTPALIGADAPF